MSIEAVRYHDFSAGHRVMGHESKCRWLHGHNYRVHFHCVGDLDDIGRVIDFGVIKSKLCQWLEDNWDHKMLLYDRDLNVIDALTRKGRLAPSVVTVPFNPTAENMAQHLVEIVGPKMLAGTGVVLRKVVVEETRKCSASYERDDV